MKILISAISFFAITSAHAEEFKCTSQGKSATFTFNLSPDHRVIQVDSFAGPLVYSLQPSGTAGSSTPPAGGGVDDPCSPTAEHPIRCN